MKKETPKSIAIQGYEGSFHHAAAEFLFGSEVHVIPCDTFRMVAKYAADKKNDGALMAIENSIAGSILSNYNLLRNYDLSVCGEIYMQINQHLLVNKGSRLKDIREVHSHTMALQQCAPFLEKHQWKLVETDDTALSAKQLSKSRSLTRGVIASELAASLYGLTIAERNIHEMKNNYTRFLYVTARANVETEANKASVMFETDHSKGSLAKVLTIVAMHDINLSKLQSFPVPGSAFRYSFYADMEFEALNQFHEALNEMRTASSMLKVFGVYKKGIWK